MGKTKRSRIARAALILAMALLLCCAVLQRRAALMAFTDLGDVDRAMRVRLALRELTQAIDGARRGDADAASEAAAHMNALATLSHDDAEQEARVAKLTRDVTGALAGDKAALAATIDDVAHIEAAEQRILAEREARAERSSSRWLMGLGFFIAAALAMAAFVIDRRGRRASRSALALLEKSERLHRVVMESATDMITLRDLAGRFLYTHNLERFIGWSADDLARMSSIAIIHEDDRPKLRAQTREVLQGRSGASTRFRLRCKDGAWRWFESVSDLVRDERGVPFAIRSATRDVMHDVERERALRQSEHLWRTVLEHVPDACILLVDHDMRCVKAGGFALHQRIGVIENPEGRLLREFVLPSNVGAIEDLLRKALRGEESGGEVSRGGRVLVIRAVPVCNDNGAIVAAMGIANDATELRHETRELERVTARLNALLDSLRFGVLFEDATRETRRTNRAMAAMLSTTVEEIEGLDRARRVAKLANAFADPTGVVAATFGHVSAGVPVVGEMLRTADGRLLERDYTPVRVDGELIGHAWCLRDVSEREATENRLRRQSDELRALSTHDELTGLANRRGLFLGAGELLGEAARNGRVAALLFADLNGMKAINDTLGHEAGDRALVAATHVLLSAFDPNAIVARLSGDEFVVLYKARDDADADRSRVLQDAIAAFNARREHGFRLSMSFGLVVAEAPFPPLDALLSRADMLMYEQKRERRTQARSLPPVRLSVQMLRVR